MAVVFATFACSAENEASPAASDGLGSLALNLTATGANGEVYRLRNAEFGISGYSYATGEYVQTSKTVSTETDPDAPVISGRLLEGDYYRGSTSTTSFRFGVNGELVDFYGGEVQIGITVEEPMGSGGVSGGGGSAGVGGAVEGGAAGAF